MLSDARQRASEPLGYPVSRWCPTGDGKDMPDIPDFLRRELRPNMEE